MVTMEKIYCIRCSKFRKSTNPKMSYLFDKTFVFLLFVISVAQKAKQYLKKKINSDFKQYWFNQKYKEEQNKYIFNLNKKHG